MRRLAGVLAMLLVCACGPDQGRLADAALASGLRQQAAGDLPAAARDYEAALLHDPNSKLAYYDLGLVWQLQGRTTDAELDYRRALAIDRDYVPALYNLALLRGRSDTRDAESLYRRVLAIQPGNAAAHYNLGLLLRRVGRTTEGDAEIARARSLNPELGPPPPAG